MAPTAPTRDELHKRALEVIDAYNSWDIDNIVALRSEDCIQQILPLSLDRPEFTNDQYRDWFGGQMMGFFKNFHVVVKDAFVDTEEKKVALWASSTAETPIGEYKNDYVLQMLFSVDHEGKLLVSRFREFVDSHNSQTFFPRLREYAEGKAKEKEGATAAV